MKMQNGAWLLALWAMGAASGASAQAELFRCHQADGSISFQQAPCPLAELMAPQVAPAPPLPGPAPAVPAPVVTAPAPAAVVPAPAAVAPARPPVAQRPAGGTPVPLANGAPAQDDGPMKPTRRKREVLELAAQFERCRADAPGFAEKSAAIHAAWTRRHAAVLAEHDRALAAKVRAARRGEVGLPLRLCTDDWLRDIEPLTQAPDPRFNTVEKTWQVFMGALMTRDRAAALSCLGGRAESLWKDRLARLTDDDLRRIGASIRSLKVQWGDDYEKEGMVVDMDNRGVGIVFRNVNEEWKITEMGGATSVPVPSP
jgi:hypothetical protein